MINWERREITAIIQNLHSGSGEIYAKRQSGLTDFRSIIKLFTYRMWNKTAN
jgi:hypothetical protein